MNDLLEITIRKDGQHVETLDVMDTGDYGTLAKMALSDSYVIDDLGVGEYVVEFSKDGEYLTHRTVRVEYELFVEAP